MTWPYSKPSKTKPPASGTTTIPTKTSSGWMREKENYKGKIMLFLYFGIISKISNMFELIPFTQ
jgi:hypothetical protein